MENVLNLVKSERLRQNEKWGIQDHNAVEWIAILTEEVGEASKEAVDFHFGNGEDNPKDEVSDKIQQMRIERLRLELVQVAAVAVQAVESIDRQLKK